jgi:hypothetical protein
VIVAPHGAGLSNLVFCQPGVKVYELFPDHYVNACMSRLAQSIHAIYWTDVFPADGESDISAHDRSWTVDVGLVTERLKLLLDKPGMIPGRTQVGPGADAPGLAKLPKESLLQTRPGQLAQVELVLHPDPAISPPQQSTILRAISLLGQHISVSIASTRDPASIRLAEEAAQLFRETGASVALSSPVDDDHEAGWHLTLPVPPTPESIAVYTALSSSGLLYQLRLDATYNRRESASIIVVR